jgi:hypothetical protein
VEEDIVVGAQCQSDVQCHRSVGAEQRPVTAIRQYFAAQLGAFERPPGRGEQNPPAERSVADVQLRFQVDDHVEEILGLDLTDGLHSRV